MKRNMILKTFAFLLATVTLICTVLSAYGLAACLASGVYENGDKALTGRAADNILYCLPHQFCYFAETENTEMITELLEREGVSAIITSPSGEVSIIGEDFSSDPNYPLTFKMFPVLPKYLYEENGLVPCYTDIDGKRKPVTTNTIVIYPADADRYGDTDHFYDTEPFYGRESATSLQEIPISPAQKPRWVLLADGTRAPISMVDPDELYIEPRYDFILSSERTTEDFDIHIGAQAIASAYRVSLDYREELSEESPHYREYRLLEFAARNKYNFIWMTVLFLALTVLLLVFLASSAGHTKKGLRPSIIEKIPFDIYLSVCALLMALPVATDDIYQLLDTSLLALTITLITAFLLGYSALIVSMIMSIALRIKLRQIFRYTLIAILLKLLLRGVRFIIRSFSYILRNIGAMWTSLVMALAFALWTVISLALLYSNGFGLLIFFGGAGFFCTAFIYVGYQINKIRRGCEKIADGGVDSKISEEYMTPNLGALASAVNGIGSGLSNALEERIKSERMKTELITNVSHDLKTPLTSIVNYTDLLSRELSSNEPRGETVSEYTEALCRQSARLKKLTEDLVEASKASTGNLESHPSLLDIGELLGQSVGEFSDRFVAAELTPIQNTPNEPIFIRADGRHVWRILENLLSNACKYSLCGTRVYIELTANAENVTIAVKNISAEPISISGEELTERFVRGDSSRHTDGSGLGLSIARSLAELQSGSLKIYADGDFFKATVTFKREWGNN